MVDVVRVTLDRTVKTNLGTKSIRSLDDALSAVRTYMNSFCSMDRENVVIVGMDIKHNITGIQTLSTGTHNTALFSPLEVFKFCLLTNSAGFILAHNHPTGDSTPSQKDIDCTKQIVEGCKVMCVRLLDHIVIGDESSFSMSENNLLD